MQPERYAPFFSSPPMLVSLVCGVCVRRVTVMPPRNSAADLSDPSWIVTGWLRNCESPAIGFFGCERGCTCAIFLTCDTFFATTVTP